MYYFENDLPASGGSTVLTGVVNSNIVYTMASGAEGTKEQISGASSTNFYNWSESRKYYDEGNTFSGPDRTRNSSNKGRNISNRTKLRDIWQTTTVLVVPVRYGATAITGTLTAETAAYQEGNYVIAIEPSSTTNCKVSFAYSANTNNGRRFPASGDTKGDWVASGDTGVTLRVAYRFTSGTLVAPTSGMSSEFGYVQSSVTYSMEEGNGFYLNPQTKMLVVSSKGTEISNVTTSNTITKNYHVT